MLYKICIATTTRTYMKGVASKKPLGLYVTASCDNLHLVTCAPASECTTTFLCSEIYDMELFPFLIDDGQQHVAAVGAIVAAVEGCGTRLEAERGG